MTQLEALNRAVVAMSTLTTADDALVEACRGLAGLIDNGKNTAGVWQQYLAALRDLSARAVEAESDDGETAFVTALSTAVGDTSKRRTKDARAGDRAGGGERRPAADAVAAAGRGRRRRAS